LPVVIASKLVANDYYIQLRTEVAGEGDRLRLQGPAGARIDIKISEPQGMDDMPSHFVGRSHDRDIEALSFLLLTALTALCGLNLRTINPGRLISTAEVSTASDTSERAGRGAAHCSSLRIRRL
jgi:hypothetical protein